MVAMGKIKMKWLYFSLLILFIYPNIVKGETQTFNFTLQNNTGLNFEAGSYIIEVIGINAQTPKSVIVNLTTDGESKTFNLYEGENPYLPKPYNKLDIIATSITETKATISVTVPSEWSYPEKYIVPTKAAGEPQIVLTKSIDKTNISVGDVVEVKIIVENKGNGTAYNLTLTEELPNGFSRAPGSRFPPQIQETLDAGGKQELYYALKAVESGTFELEPTTVTYGVKSSQSNTITIKVAEILEVKSNLTTAISVDKDSVKTDDTIRVDVKITNIGKAPATSVLLDGNVPSGLITTEGDLKQGYKKIDAGESEVYTVLLKAIEPGNYSIDLKTFYNDDKDGTVSTSKPITVTKNEKGYLYIIIPVVIIVIGIVLFAVRRHKQYSF
ncbi:Uncharacterised protein [uncultured archaeon]|nr:Uncharacterised protein [uncultured archaeon]